MKVPLIILISFMIILFFALQLASADQKSVVIIEFDYAVDSGAQDYFQSTLTYAEQNGYPVIIIMNTPGGYLVNAFSIASMITSAESEINITTYIPPGDMGASAGSYIAMASDNIFMGNGSFIGPSKPYIIGGTALEEQHVVNASLAYMIALAQDHGRNVSAVATMVENNTAYSALSALQVKIINGIANSLSQVKNILGYSGYSDINFTESPIQQFESFISNSTVAGFFILIGTIAILLDIYHGSILLSVLGIISIAIGLWGSQLIGAQPVGLLMIFIGMALIFLEIKLGHGLAMLSGVFLAVAGSLLMTVDIPYSSNVPYLSFGNYALIAIEATLLPIGAIYIIALRKAAMRAPAKVGPERIVGKNGVAKTDIIPGKEGVANVLSEDWTAISDEIIKAGEKITVLEYSEGKIRVKKII